MTELPRRSRSLLFGPGTSRALATACAALLGIGGAIGAEAGPTRADDETAPAVDFNREVRPILSKRCYACHGPDPEGRKADLRLDDREVATAELPDGMIAIVPGDPDASELIFRVSEPDDTIRMPPKGAGELLTEEEVATLTRWIEGGAKYDTHWAFVPPTDPAPPEVSDPSWARDGLDRFILARLDREQLRPSAEADRFTLLRRVSLDLRGLPPSPAEVAAFQSDESPGAYERAVDRLLADPGFGEHWARTWLDLARYADSAGYGSDPLRPDAWRYRDWVISALNRNLSHDKFSIEQLAGDLLPDPTLEQKVATAFHRQTMTNTEGGTIDEEWRVAAVKDRVNTTAQVWMGLTFACAQCHAHKFDPISQEDYYRLFAAFNQTLDDDQPDESPTVPAPTRDQTAAIARVDARIAEVRASGAGRMAVGAAVANLEKSKPDPPAVPVMAELPAGEHRESHVLHKGSYLDPGPVVVPGLPSAFASEVSPGDEPIDRMDVAEWLVDSSNPLASRVAVNRLWARVFGIGLVATEEDFGTQGEPPSHPELLDWLASRYVESGWDTKAMLRRIVTSSTYRQSSKVTAESIRIDPANRLLARAPRPRLEAEEIRDQALALSGLLSREIGGPSVFPPQPAGLWQAAFNGQRTWATDKGNDRHRRGLYTFWRRTIPYPSMAAFDAPSRELCTVRRSKSNTPLQAFVTLNDPAFVEASQALARRIVREGGDTVDSRARYGLALCTGRPAGAGDASVLVDLFEAERARYEADPEAAEKLASDPLGPLPEGSDPAELAAWTAVANVLLNLDAVLTKG